jgi:hypothetical protein
VSTDGNDLESGDRNHELDVRSASGTGSVTIKSRAFDDSGNETPSAGVNITVGGGRWRDAPAPSGVPIHAVEAR